MTIDSGNGTTKPWIVVRSVDNWQRTGQWTVDRAFMIQGLTSRRRTKAEQMRPGDKTVHYVTGIKAFAGVATITSGYVEDSEPIRVSGNATRAGEDYPFRVWIEPDVALAREDVVPAEGIVRRMASASTWPTEHWTLAFQGNVHLIPEEDYRLIREAIDSAG